LTHATGRLRTLYGELVSQWKLENDQFEWKVIVPPNTTATVYLPLRKGSKIKHDGQTIHGAVHEVEAGEYLFVVSG
jgi:alpha-L-rhamnosidase